MDWYTSLSTAAGIRIEEEHPVIDGRDLWPMFKGKVDGIPSPEANLSLNAQVPFRRRWQQGLEWEQYFSQEDYPNAFFCHGSHGALAAVRSDPYKLFLNPQVVIYNLDEDPGEEKPIRNRDLVKRLRGMAVMFQEEMSRDARQVGVAERPGDGD